MPKDYQGFDETQSVQISEAAGGKGYKPRPASSGFEGRSESNLADSEALKKGPKIPVTDSGSRER